MLTKTIKVKLCGFTQQYSLEAAIKCKCDFVGFVFHNPSPRNITLTKARELSPTVPTNIAKVAVVVDASDDMLQKINDNLNPEIYQFHGHETIQYIEQFKKKFPDKKIIKAFAVESKKDVTNSKNYEAICDYFLYDSKSNNNFGGTGTTFDWSIFQEETPNKKWFLSGGLNVNNIAEAITTSQTEMIDTSSGIEEFKGQKSIKLIQELMQKVKSL